MLDSNSKPNEEIKISAKGKYTGKYKNSIMVFLVCDSTFYLLQDLKDKFIKKLLIYVTGCTINKDIICDKKNIKGGGCSCPGVEFLYFIDVKLISFQTRLL